MEPDPFHCRRWEQRRKLKDRLLVSLREVQVRHGRAYLVASGAPEPGHRRNRGRGRATTIGLDRHQKGRG